MHFLYAIITFLIRKCAARVNRKTRLRSKSRKVRRLKERRPVYTSSQVRHEAPLSTRLSSPPCESTILSTGTLSLGTRQLHCLYSLGLQRMDGCCCCGKPINNIHVYRFALPRFGLAAQHPPPTSRSGAFRHRKVLSQSSMTRLLSFVVALATLSAAGASPLIPVSNGEETE